VIDRRGLAIDANFASVTLVGARENLDQRRLACAVMAQKSDHLALMQADRGVVDGADTSERDGDVGHFDQWRAGIQHNATTNACSGGRACRATPRKPERYQPRWIEAGCRCP